MKLITEPEYQAFVYKWQNIQTGEYYIGVHKGSVDDGYIGSGKKFIAKYRSAPTAFKRTIIQKFKTYQDALALESQLVTKDLILSDSSCLNLKPGGEGGGFSFWDNDKRLSHSQMLRERWSDESYKIKMSLSLSAVHTAEHKKRQMEAGNYFPYKKIDQKKRVNSRKKNVGGYGKHMIGVPKSDKTKAALSLKAKARERIDCPHCNKNGPIPQMKRWHFDQCKEKLKCS